MSSRDSPQSTVPIKRQQKKSIELTMTTVDIVVIDNDDVELVCLFASHNKEATRALGPCALCCADMKPIKQRSQIQEALDDADEQFEQSHCSSKEESIRKSLNFELLKFCSNCL